MPHIDLCEYALYFSEYALNFRVYTEVNMKNKNQGMVSERNNFGVLILALRGKRLQKN